MTELPPAARRTWTLQTWRGCLLVISASLSLLGGEMLVRAFRPQQTYSWLLEATGEQYVDGGFIPFTLKPNYHSWMPSMEHPGSSVPVSTNSHGMRGPEFTLAKPRGTTRILLLGDSYTFGLYCADNETCAVNLEQTLRGRGMQVEVLNAGYADGWSPDEHYAWLVDRGLELDPDVVIYGFFIGNDLTDITPVNWVSLDDTGLPIRIVNPEIRVDVTGRIRSSVRDWRTVGTEFTYRVPLLRESHLFVGICNAIARRLPVAGPGDRTAPRNPHANPGGAQLLAWITSASSDEWMLKQEAAFFRLVEGMKSRCARAGARFAVMMIPINAQVEPEVFLPMLARGEKLQIRRNFFEEIKPRLRAARIEYVDLLRRMQQAPGQYYPRNGEVHLNPAGQAFAARCLADELFDSGTDRHTPGHRPSRP